MSASPCSFDDVDHIGLQRTPLIIVRGLVSQFDNSQRRTEAGQAEHLIERGEFTVASAEFSNGAAIPHDRSVARSLHFGNRHITGDCLLGLLFRLQRKAFPLDVLGALRGAGLLGSLGLLDARRSPARGLLLSWSACSFLSFSPVAGFRARFSGRAPGTDGMTRHGS
jgi:hypothetical protein